MEELFRQSECKCECEWAKGEAGGGAERHISVAALKPEEPATAADGRKRQTQKVQGRSIHECHEVYYV